MTIKIKENNNDIDMTKIILFSQHLYSNYDTWKDDIELQKIVNNDNSLYILLKNNNSNLDDKNIKSIVLGIYLYFYKFIFL